MYGLVPPVNDAVQLTVCPTSSFADDGQFDSVGVVGAPEITVRVPVFTELVAVLIITTLLLPLFVT